MNRMTWTAIGAAGLMAGTTVGGFALVTATAADRAVRPIELRDVVDPATGEPRGQLADGSVDSATGLPKPIVTISPSPAAAPTDAVDSDDASPEVVSKPVVKETAKPKPTVTRPAAADSADSADSSDSADDSD